MTVSPTICRLGYIYGYKPKHHKTLENIGSQPILKQEIVSYSTKIGVLITVVDLLIEREQGNKKKAQLVITDDVVHYIVVSQATIIPCRGR
jgi:hypothetical protein